ncbi:MAG: hypothetical protein BWY76_01743 [bacterium ADurb.Bin429]|nr:MAG: hypothetical protein BWY76_01743 [bacterium ADurb.Bin429]
MHSNVKQAWEVLWAKFYHPDTHQLYDYEIVDPAQFPTYEEVTLCIPYANAPRPVNDPTLVGSWVLAACLQGYDATGEAAYADRARRLFIGLTRLARLARTPGYIPRGSVPGHDTVYPNSSVDQYTGFCYAMWRYWSSAVATSEEKAEAVTLVCNAATLISRYHHNIPCDDLLPSYLGDIGNSDDPFRGCRLLHLYKTAFIMSGDARWEDLYRAKMEEGRRRRLATLFGPDTYPWSGPCCSWAMWQNQAALRVLYETETDAELRRVYRASLDGAGWLVLPWFANWREAFAGKERRIIPDLWRAYWPHFERAYPDHDRRRTTFPLHPEVFRDFIREHEGRIPIPEVMLARATVAKGELRAALQYLAVALFAEDPDLHREAAREGLPMLTGGDMTQPECCGELRNLGNAYWRGVEVGVFPAP